MKIFTVFCCCSVTKSCLTFSYPMDCSKVFAECTLVMLVWKDFSCFLSWNASISVIAIKIKTVFNSSETVLSAMKIKKQLPNQPNSIPI